MHYDLIIVGGGLVGAGLACALSSDLRIAVIDARTDNINDPRLFALNHGSCQFLTHLGLWPKLQEYAAAIHQVHVSHKGHFGSVRLTNEDVSVDSLGHVIPAYHIENALTELMSQRANVTLYRPATLQTLKQTNNAVEVTLATPSGVETLSSTFVIGADGAESTVRSQIDVEADVFDYQQSALVTRTQLNRSHHHIAYERFNDSGAIAMLPLPDCECATIWTADHATISELMNLSDDLFLQKLQQEFGYRLGRLQKISKRHIFPLRGVRAKKMVVGNILLLGNAAHTLHPIAAQGFNVALFEVAILAEHLLHKRQQHDVLAADDLKQIEAQITKQLTTRINFSHKLTQLFTKQTLLNNSAITLGMMGLDMIMPIKKKFIQELIGKRGHVPDLLLSINE